MSERNHHSAEKDNVPVDWKATDSVQDNSKDRVIIILCFACTFTEGLGSDLCVKA